MRAQAETRCAFCLQIFCCAQHRIHHEDRKHLVRRRQKGIWNSRNSGTAALAGKSTQDAFPPSPPDGLPPPKESVPPPGSNASTLSGASRKRKREYLNPSFGVVGRKGVDGIKRNASHPTSSSAPATLHSVESGGVLSIISSVANVFRNAFGGQQGEGVDEENEEPASRESSSSMAMSPGGRTAAAETPTRRRSAYYTSEDATARPEGNRRLPLALRSHHHPHHHPSPPHPRRRILVSPRERAASSS